MSGKNRKWIQRVVRRPGRVRKYIMKKIGPSGFTSRGTIKEEALVKAKKIAHDHHDVGMEDAINLAMRLRKMGRRKR